MSRKFFFENNIFVRQIKIRDWLGFLYISICLVSYLASWFSLKSHLLMQGTIIIVFFICNIVLFILLGVERSLKITILEFYVALFCAGLIFYSVKVTNGSSGSLILLISVVMLIVLIKHLSISHKLVNVFVIGMFLLYIYYIFIFDTTVFNPNTVGFIILVGTIYACLALRAKRQSRYFISIVIIISFLTIINTDSRASLLGLLIFIVFDNVIHNRIFSKRLFVVGFYFLFTFGSVVFSRIYVELWVRNIDFRIPFSDKPLYTGRENIWNEIFVVLEKNYLWGIGSNFEISSFYVLNIHNSMLHIMVIYGIPIFVIFVFLVGYRLWELAPLSKVDKRIKTSLAGFLSLLVVGFFESTFTDSFHVIPTFFLLLISYSFCNKKINLEKNNENIDNL